MTLMEAFNEHLTTGQQGQLVVKFAGDVHLCKILVEDGKAVHIAHGRLAPELIIDTLTYKVVEWVKFIAGYPVRKKVAFALHENLLAAAGQQSPAPSLQPAPSLTPAAVAPPQPPAAVADEPSVQAENVTAAIEGFIELIGPLGTILAEQALSGLNYTSGTALPQSYFNRFVQTLAKDVADAERDPFIAQYKL